MYKLLVLCLLTTFGLQTSYSQSGSVVIHESPKIKKLVTIKKNLEKENKLSQGYTIQLYYGDKNQANSVIKKYRNTYGSWPASIEYETPNYKVWVGDFNTRFEADRALLEIKKTFPAAFILKPERAN
jgi:hypothetical protein